MGLYDNYYVVGTYLNSQYAIVSNGNLRLIREMTTVVYEEGYGHMRHPYKDEVVLPNARMIAGQLAQNGTVISPAKFLVKLPDTREVVVVEIDQGVTLAKVCLTRKTKRQMARGD